MDPIESIAMDPIESIAMDPIESIAMDPKTWQLKVFLQNQIPIAGCELKLWFHVNVEGSLSPPPNCQIKFNWHRVEKDGQSWSQVGSSENYTPSIYDVGSIFRLEAVAVDEDGVARSPVVVLVTSPTISPPSHYQRRMIDFSTNSDFKHPRSIKEFKAAKGGTISSNFSVLSYNILADLSVGFNHDRYYYCPTWALTWEYRRHNIIKEILEYDADVICLQELQSDHLEDFFKPKMEEFGYSVIYKSKTQKVHTVNGCTIDGCAIFFRRSRFTLLKHYDVELSKFVVSIIEDFEPDKKKDAYFRLIKDNVAIVGVLQDNHAKDKLKSRVCIANTHIHSNSKLPDVKLMQVSNFIKGIEVLASLDIPTIICGDMNSPPNTHPYRLITKGKVKSLDKSADPMQICKHLQLRHSMKLASVYSKLNENAKEPYTTITPIYRGTLDYIFYTKAMLQVDGLLEQLDDQTLEQMFLPSPLWSSDHIALMASFRVCKSSEKLHDDALPLYLWE